MRTFPPAPITRLIDEPLSHPAVPGMLDEPIDGPIDLGESQVQVATVGELLGDRVDELGELGELPLAYGSPAGERRLRDLIGARTGVPAEQVEVTTGAASAIFLLALLALDGDGEVVVQRPCFPPMHDAVLGLGGRVVPVRATFRDGYRLDLDALTGCLTPRTRLVLLASPQNPSGVSLTVEEVTAVAEAMARRCPDALLLVDETYREATYGTAAAPSMAGLVPRLLTCASLSKAHGAPGLRVGWLTVPDAALAEQVRLAKFNAVISCGRLDEHLAVRLLERADEVLRPRRARLAEGLAIVAEWVTAHRDLVQWRRPDAGGFCAVRVRPDVVAAADLAPLHRRLAARGVTVAPGGWFGDEPHVLRIGFGYPPAATLRAGLARVAAELSRCPQPAAG